MTAQSRNRGARGSGYNAGHSGVMGRFKGNRVAWTNLPTIAVLVHENDLETEMVLERETEWHQGIIVTVSRIKGKKAVSFDLTHMTQEELAAFRKIINLACDLAEPRCEALDENAKEAFRNGEDTFTRLYRPIPEVVVRDGKSREYNQSLRDRLASLVGRGRGSNSDGAPGEGSAGLPESEED